MEHNTDETREIDDAEIARIAFHNMLILALGALLSFGVGSATMEIGGGILMVVGVLCSVGSVLYGIRWAIRGA